MPWKNKEDRNAWVRKYRRENKERLRQRDRETERQWRIANKEKILVKQRRHRAENIDRYREYNARWHRENRANNPSKVRDMHLRSAYDLTLEQYNAILAFQNNGCAVCGSLPPVKPLHVDHCHTTGRVRGLLCHGCNTGSGMADNIDLLQKKVAYLQRSTNEELTSIIEDATQVPEQAEWHTT